MKVCHVISGYFRNDARNFQRQALSLKKAGYDVCFVTNDGEPDGVLEGIPFTSCKMRYPRWKTLVAAKYQFLPELFRVDADVYQLHSPELLPLAAPLHRMGKGVVYDAHEDLPRHMLEKEWVPGAFRRPLSWLSEAYLERTLGAFVDEVVSPHGHVVDALQRSIGKGVLVANFPVVEPLTPVSDAEFAARENVICYSGTVYLHSNQEATLEALASLPDVRYRVAGYIGDAHRRALESQAAAGRVEFMGRVARSELRRLYTSTVAGMAIIDYRLNQGGRRGSYAVNKVFEYMEAGLPLICTDYELWRELVERYECGVCVRPGSVSDIRAAVALLTSDRALAHRMGQNGRRAVLEEFNWGKEERKYLEVFRRLEASRGRGGRRRAA